ncbi:MAG: DNA polymerase III subunit alpha [Nitratireductor sp.]
MVADRAVRSADGVRDGEGAGSLVGKGPGYVHLHVHSAFSLLEGAMQLAKVVELAVADRQPAIAITDRNNLFGALEFSEKAGGKGLQPIMGVKLAVDFADGLDARPKSGFLQSRFLVLLAMNQEGFANITRLVSKAHLEGDAASEADGNGSIAHQGPHIGFADLERLNGDIIVLTGGPDGPLDCLIDDDHADGARARLRRLKSVFGNRLYVELQRHRQDGRERRCETHLLAMAYAEQVAIVATNQCYFARRDDFEAHDALVAIAEGSVVASEDRRRLTPEHYFKSRSEMMALFADLPEALDNTVEIAQRCAFRARKHDPILPRFTGESNDPVAAVAAESEELKRQAREGLRDRMQVFEPATGFTLDDYDQRLEFELGIIEQMGFPGYFLIVSDFIKWAKAQDIPVGPGRGSGAGSLVAWALTITDIDPMRFSLLFERFLNPERVSMPDFDIDFCQERREEVIRYVQEKYGRGQVAQIITFGSLQARAVLRDVGRVLQMPYGQVDRLCKLVPSNPANPVSLKDAIIGEPRLREAQREEEIVSTLFDISTRLEGLYRHASTHAAGIVIGDRPLEELVPLYRDPRSDMPVTQYSMKWAEAAGLVKFDFLGLKTLTVIRKAVEFIAQRSDTDGEVIDISAIPIDDPNTYEMLARGETVGVFQLESMGMRKALIGMKPDRFEDIIALVALYRPGPMDNIPVYNDRKNGLETAKYIDDKIEPVLRETHGVIIYQEQVMQIAQILSGYSLGEADMLRRAMGKKIREEMDQQRARFVDGAVEGGLTKSKANEIFDLLAKFADYGFNKSHAAAYALVSYQTAWLKAGYPVEFLAASMQLDINNTDKLAIFHQEAGDRGIEIVPPSVQTSEAGFSVGEDKIYYALAAIKGVGEAAVRQIVAERKANGNYRDITDFFSRIDIRQVNRRTLESLITAGALDCFGHMREQLMAGLERLVGHASRTAQDRDSGQNDMFAASGGSPVEAITLPAATVWMPAEKLHREFQSIGFYLSSHPLDEYRQLLQKMRVQLFAEFEKSVRAGASAGRLAGTVTGRQERKTKTGKRMGIVQLSDPSGQYEAVIFEEGLSRFRDLLEAGRSVILLAGADVRPEGVSVRIQSVESLEEQATREASNLRIFLRDDKPVRHLTPLLKPNGRERGEGRVSFVVIEDEGAREIEVELRERFQVTPQIARAIKGIPGVMDVELV